MESWQDAPRRGLSWCSADGVVWGTWRRCSIPSGYLLVVLHQQRLHDAVFAFQLQHGSAPVVDRSAQEVHLHTQLIDQGTLPFSKAALRLSVFLADASFAGGPKVTALGRLLLGWETTAGTLLKRPVLIWFN